MLSRVGTRYFKKIFTYPLLPPVESYISTVVDVCVIGKRMSPRGRYIIYFCLHCLDRSLPTDDDVKPNLFFNLLYKPSSCPIKSLGVPKCHESLNAVNCTSMDGIKHPTFSFSSEFTAQKTTILLLQLRKYTYNPNPN